jgi:catechol-2,3-dioxygenase
VATATGIARLGHTGLWVDDLDRMRDFYVNVLGVEVTDEDPEIGIVFLSSRPREEHHELVLQRGRVGGPEVRVVHQISWRLDSLAALQAFDRRLAAAAVPVQQRVTHGNALGIYFFDPEGNRNEVYWATGREVPQPFRKSIDMSLPAEELVRESDRRVADDTPAYQPPAPT